MYCMGLQQHPFIVVLTVMDFKVSYGEDFRKMFSYVKFVVSYGSRLHCGLH